MMWLCAAVAICSCRDGAMTWSWVPSTYQLGRAANAGGPDFSFSAKEDAPDHHSGSDAADDEHR